MEAQGSKVPAHISSTSIIIPGMCPSVFQDPPWSSFSSLVVPARQVTQGCWQSFPVLTAYIKITKRGLILIINGWPVDQAYY